MLDAPAAAPPGDDSVLPFQLDRADIRGRVGRLDGALDAILTRHDYPAPVAALAAEAALLTALIGQTVKLRWRLSLQVRGDGPVRLIATDYFAPEREGEPARIRAWAGFDRAAVEAAAGAGTAFDRLGRGLFAITIDQGPDMAPYQGVTPLTGGSLAASAETYFAQSEQIATRFAMTAGAAAAPGSPERWRGGGVMIQHVAEARPHAAPDAPSGPEGLMGADDVAAMAGAGEAWSRVNLLLDTVEAHELIGPHVSPERLLLRLFHEETPRVWPAQPVRFGCTCSLEKVSDALAGSSEAEIAEMTTEQGDITADCQFCGERYALAPNALRE
jgi:molecular chaperone Hsp33